MKIAPVTGPAVPEGASRADDAAGSPAVRKRLAELREASQAFEAILFQEMLSVMVRANTQGGFFGSEGGSETMQHMFERTLSENVGAEGSLGIAEMLYRQLAPAIRGAHETARDPDKPPEINGLPSRKTP